MEKWERSSDSLRKQAASVLKYQPSQKRNKISEEDTFIGEIGAAAWVKFKILSFEIIEVCLFLACEMLLASCISAVT